MSRSPRGTTTGGYFFKVVIFIKVKKYIVVALAVMSVLVSSCVSAFALSDEYSKIDEFNADFIKQFLSNDDTFKEYSKQSNYYFVSCSTGGSNHERHFIVVNFFDDNKFVADKSLAGAGKYFFTRKSFISYEYSYSKSTYLIIDKSSESDYIYTYGFDDIIYSTVDIISSDDNSVFFQKPLSLLEKLLNPLPKHLGEKITADLGTLTICGISLIALLIGCALVPKVLHKFRV